MHLLQILLLAVIQGMAELLPVSSSAHVIVTEKLMGLDPTTPEMTFLLVMLHTGTMFAVLLYFWPRWKKLKFEFFKAVAVATAFTGVIGLGLKKMIEKVILEGFLGHAHGEVESLFKSLPLMGTALLSVGVLIWITGRRESLCESLPENLNEGKVPQQSMEIPLRSSIWIGIVQGLCLPFRGFSRSGATISTGMLLGVSRMRAEDFSFALAVVLTPPVVVLELHRLVKSVGGFQAAESLGATLFFPGLIGMIFSFGAGLLALRWLSSWLERGRWKFFGIYCIVASIGVFTLYAFGF